MLFDQLFAKIFSTLTRTYNLLSILSTWCLFRYLYAGVFSKSLRKSLKAFSSKCKRFLQHVNPHYTPDKKEHKARFVKGAMQAQVEGAGSTTSTSRFASISFLPEEQLLSSTPSRAARTDFINSGETAAAWLQLTVRVVYGMYWHHVHKTWDDVSIAIVIRTARRIQYIDVWLPLKQTRTIIGISRGQNCTQC